MYKLIVFDFDATLIKEEPLVLMAERKGVAKEVSKITEKAMNDELDFREALRLRVELLKGLPYSEVLNVRDELTPANGAYETIYGLKKKEITPVVITGGYKIFVEPIAHKLGIEHYFSNDLIVDDDKITEVKGEIMGGEDKVKVLDKFIKPRGIYPAQCVGVGDGSIDISLLEYCGLAIGWNAKKNVRPYCQVNIDSDDLSTILKYIK